VASEVKEGECGGFNPITEEFTLTPIMDIVEREKRPTIGYYAMLELTNGFRKEIFWTKEQMESHALKYSKGYAKKSGYTFWEKDFDGMAYKTMLRQLISKWGIMSIDMQTAIDSDMAVINEDGTRDYVDTVDNEIVADTVESHTEPNNEPTGATETASDVESALFGGK
jgi:recombination protein RecT